MQATIVHESRGRMRLRLRQKNISIRQADLLETWLKGQPWTREAVVHERTCCVIVTYTGDREAVLSALGAFTWAGAESSVTLPGHSTRTLNREFQEKLVGKVAVKAATTLFLPAPLRIARIVWHMIPFLHRGLRCLGHRQIKVEMLDALSIGISVCRRDFGTAGTVMFLLEIGELLEDWTRKKSVADLAESLSLHVDRVWLKTEAGEVLTSIGQIRPGDWVVVRAGSVIPLDGVVEEGEITVNQASLTGESVPVAKRSGGAVYAGTVVEEGECVLEVKQATGQSRYDQIVEMIQRSEQMKSAAEAKASNLADKLVPYTFAGSLVSLALTRNVTRALSVLMVDFSCALKLAMPLAVLSALRVLGVRNAVMLTGDSPRTAAAIAEQLGVDAFRAGVLPADKAEYVAALRKEGHTVLMVGDGINDSPALSEADAGIAISDGAAIAREIADITIAADSLWELVRLRQLAMALMRRIRNNYRFVIGFNGALIGLGVTGILPPTTSAMLHNLSTLGVSLHSMTALPQKKQD